jgi:hypothetical protein
MQQQRHFGAHRKASRQLIFNIGAVDLAGFNRVCVVCVGKSVLAWYAERYRWLLLVDGARCNIMLLSLYKYIPAASEPLMPAPSSLHVVGGGGGRTTER